MGFNCGIIGLPNTGKSTLFNALTAAGAAASNFPFCTVDPNIGRVPLPDERLETAAKMVNAKNVVPTQMEFVDIAGLVKGASSGEGLGNRFLSHIRGVDAVAHVVRCFASGEVSHVMGSVDQLRDIEIVESELMLADLESVERKLTSLRKAAKSGDRKEAEITVNLQTIAESLQKGIPASEINDAPLSYDLPLLTAKPIMYVANISTPEDAEGEMAAIVRDYAKKRSASFVTVSAKLEQEIMELPPEEREAYREEMGLLGKGIEKFIQSGYELLGLITFLTAGPKEARAWTITDGMTALEAAGKIHTDFMKKFIRAEVITYDDYVSCGGEQGAKDAGKMRLEGKEYVVKDGDVIYFRISG
ncbi:MAG: redox-regulated ATPase YchF [Nitrospinota bacterium]